MAQLNDNEQFERIKAGDVGAYEVVFKHYYQKLCNFACSILNDMDEAEEVVQQVFLNIWERKERIEITLSLHSYLYRAVRNECMNRLKHIKVRMAHKAEAEYTAGYTVNISNHNIESGELEKEIYAAVESLPEQCRIIFRMSRFEEMKYSEIAAGLSISIKTVENQIGKALRIMRLRLADYLPFFIIFFILNK